MAALYFGGFLTKQVKPSRNGATTVWRTYQEPRLHCQPKSPTPFGEDPRDIAERREVEKIVHQALHTLSSRERLIVQLRYGFICFHPWTISEIADELSMTEEQVSRALAHATRKLHSPLTRLA